MARAAAQPLRRRFSLAQLALLTPATALVVAAWKPITDNSFLWHIRAGELQADVGRVLTRDPFSFTMADEPWRTQSWLAELLYGWGEGVSGLGFTPLMLFLTSLTAMAGIGLVAYARSRSVTATVVILVLSVVLLAPFLVPRPVVFSHALFALVAAAWGSERLRWTAPFLFWVWASVHGSFVVGLAFIGLWLIADCEWRLLPTAVVSGLCTLLTAHGPGVIEILTDFSGAGEALELLTEWRKPDLASPLSMPLAAGVVIIIIGAARRIVAPRHLWLVAPFAALGLSAVRAGPPAWIGLVPLVALSLRDLGGEPTPRFPTPAAALFAVAVVGAPLLLTREAALDEERFPLAAADHLRDVNVIHDDRVGGYLIWRDGPDRRVFIDDRAELYGERLVEFADLRDADADWRPVFERDGIEQALLRVEDGLVADLEGAGWREAYRDGAFVVLDPPS